MSKIKRNPFIIILVLLSLYSCQKNNKPAASFKKHFFAMDTFIEVIIADNKIKDPEKYFKLVSDEFKRIEKLFSPYDSTSDIWEINRSRGRRIKIDTEVFSLIETAVEFSKKTHGAFDITIWPLVKLWGFGQPDMKVPDKKDIVNTLKYVNYNKIHLFHNDKSIQFSDKNMGIDLGAIAKGYALDKSNKLLKKAKLNNFLINAGGDIIVSGNSGNDEKWKIGIQDPREEISIIETLEASDKAIVTSGDYERFFFQNNRRYHHILNPKTGYPSEKCISVTISADSSINDNAATVADVLSTAVFVLGEKGSLDILNNFKDIEMIIVKPDLKVTRLSN